MDLEPKRGLSENSEAPFFVVARKDAIPTGAALATKLDTDGNLPGGKIFKIASDFEPADHRKQTQTAQAGAEHKHGGPGFGDCAAITTIKCATALAWLIKGAVAGTITHIKTLVTTAILSTPAKADIVTACDIKGETLAVIRLTGLAGRVVLASQAVSVQRVVARDVA